MDIQKNSVLCIPVDRCLAGDQLLIDEEVDPSFLELSEKDEIATDTPVRICGKVYHAQEWLIVNASITAQLRLPCSTCNEPFHIHIDLPSFSHQEPVDSIQGGFWDMGAVVREAILLEVPFFARCGGSTCTHMEEIQRYFRDPEKETDGHQPFRDL